MGPLNIFAKSNKGCLTEMVSDPERLAGRYGATFTGRDRWWFGFSNGAGMWDMVGSGVNILLDLLNARGVGGFSEDGLNWNRTNNGNLPSSAEPQRALTGSRHDVFSVFATLCNSLQLFATLCNSLLVRRLFGAIRVWAQLGLRGPRGGVGTTARTAGRRGPVGYWADALSPVSLMRRSSVWSSATFCGWLP
jgi:hypothetical protein